jgi:hypothetical protein
MEGQLRSMIQELRGAMTRVIGSKEQFRKRIGHEMARRRAGNWSFPE